MSLQIGFAQQAYTKGQSSISAGYGFINAETPELSIAIDENHRNKGIGTRLLSAIFEALRQANYTQISLSVDSRNLAYPLYLKLGFVEYSTDEYSVKMIKTL